MAQAINSIRIPVTTTGSAGSATGDTTTAIPQGIRGALMSFYVDCHASLPATTDITITEVGGAGRTLFTLTNRNTGGEFPVRISEVGTTGTAGSGVTTFLLDGTQIKVALAQANALTNAVVVYAYILQ